MGVDKKVLGTRGEQLAADYLAERGVSIIARNARTPYGELDLIGFHAEILVFFEVKTRRTDTYGYPEESISSTKREHLAASAQAFVQGHPELPNQWRIDVIAIYMKRGQKPEFEWFENAIS
jgi:putative endonuclease